MSFFPVGMSTLGKVGLGMDVAGKIGGLFGGNDDGVSGKQLGAQRVQSAYMSNLAVDQQTKMYDLWKEKMYPLQRRQIEDRVRDAKASGLHPLFALGQPSSNLPAFTAGVPSTGIPGQSRTGSHKGDKLAAAGQAMLGIDQQQANIRLTDAQAAYYNSMVKSGEAHNDATQTHPSSEHGKWLQSKALHARETKAQEYAQGARESYPKSYKTGSGKEIHWSEPGQAKRLSSQLGDEGSQIPAVIQGVVDYWSQTDPGGLFKWLNSVQSKLDYQRAKGYRRGDKKQRKYTPRNYPFFGRSN